MLYLGRSVAKEMPEDLPILPSNDRCTHESRARRITTETVSPRSLGHWGNPIWQFWECSLWIHKSSVCNLRGWDQWLQGTTCGNHIDHRYVWANELFRRGKCRASEESVCTVRQQVAQKAWSMSGSRDVLSHILVWKIIGQRWQRGKYSVKFLCLEKCFLI